MRFIGIEDFSVGRFEVCVQVDRLDREVGVEIEGTDCPTVGLWMSRSETESLVAALQRALAELPEPKEER